MPTNVSLDSKSCKCVIRAYDIEYFSGAYLLTYDGHTSIDY